MFVNLSEYPRTNLRIFRIESLVGCNGQLTRDFSSILDWLEVYYSKGLELMEEQKLLSEMKIERLDWLKGGDT